MSATTLGPPVTVEEYLLTSYEPECEYVDGELIEKPMPKRLHSLLQFLILVRLGELREQLGIVVCPELRIEVAPRRYRVPDICVFSAPFTDDTPTIPPVLTIEIASDNEGMPGLLAKVRDHHEMGVSTIIVADPASQTVMVAREDGLLQQIASPQLVSVPTPRGALELDFDQLFRDLVAASSGT